MNRRKAITKEIMSRFEEMMSAAAFAEEGDFETARKALTARHRILLVLTGMETDTKAAAYALNISERINAGIEILHLGGGVERSSFLDGYLAELKVKGIEYRITTGEGSIKDEIMNFTEKMSDIQFVIIDSQDLEIGCEKKEGAILHGWEGLECPLVLVSCPAES